MYAMSKGIKSDGSMKRKGSEARVKGSAGSLGPNAAAKAAGNFFPTYQTLEDPLIAQKSLDVLSSKRGSQAIPLTIES